MMKTSLVVLEKMSNVGENERLLNRCENRKCAYDTLVWIR
jgi:hypothetical protein